MKRPAHGFDGEKMSGNDNKVLLAGATGLVGGLCLKRLLADDFFQSVITVGRRPLPDASADPRLTQVIADLGDLGPYASEISAATVICALGSTMKKAGSKDAFYKVDFTYAFNLAKTARQNGASQFLLVSALGASPKALSFYARVKGELEKEVAGLGFESLTIFRPSLMLGKRGEFRMGEEIAKVVAPRVNFAIPKKYRPIEAETVAAALWIAARLKKPGVNIYESDAISRLYGKISGKEK